MSVETYIDTRRRPGDIQSMAKDFVERKLLEHDKLFQKIDRRFDAVDKRFAEIDKRFDAVDKRFAEIDKRFDAVDKRFAEIDKRFDAVDKRFAEIDKRFESLENFLAENMNLILNHLDGLTAAIKRLDEERLFQTHRLDRHEHDINRLKAAIDLPAEETG